MFFLSEWSQAVRFFANYFLIFLPLQKKTSEAWKVKKKFYAKKENESHVKRTISWK